ncbi:hypothetical protein SNE40_022733 [Patella caerulea]|uniref:MRH domain-containing protein n=1 Tax=Patella caerulea TaxID=87958 RepID=A0AAN8FX57_PATCE
MFRVFSFLLTVGFSLATDGPVRWLDNSCVIETSQGTIDLTPLGNTDNTPRFKDLQGTTDHLYSYSWNPCLPFNEGTCTDVAICQSGPGQQVFFILGLQNKISYEEGPDQSGSLVYHTYGDIERTTTIRLTCDPTQEGNLIVTGEQPYQSGKYFFELRSQYACFQEPTTTFLPPTPGHVTATASPSPNPDIYNVKSIVLLLFTIQVSLIILLVMLFIGLVTRRQSTVPDKDTEKSQFAYKSMN